MSWNTTSVSGKMRAGDKIRVMCPWICFGVIEWTWNVFPSTPISSMVWQCMHWGTLIDILVRANRWKSEWKKKKNLEKKSD
jgi:hypothetical protein